MPLPEPSIAVPSVVDPSLNATLPDGAGPLAVVTIAPSETLCPAVIDVGDAVATTAVAIALIFNGCDAEVSCEYVESPAYCAVTV